MIILIADDEIKKTAANTNQEKLDHQVEAGTLFRADTLEELAVKVAGGIHAGNHLGGNALTDIFTFRRIAGKTAVDEMK